MAWREIIGRIRGETWIDGVRALVLRDAAVASKFARPTSSGAEQVDPCDACKRPFEEHIITTGGPPWDAAIWDEVQVVVDGWVCGGCREVRYPRAISAATSVTYGERGAAAARAGQWREAEWWFTRIAWAWPGYAPAYLDIAGALRARLDANVDVDEARGRIERRMQRAFDDAVEAGERRRDATSPAVLAAAYLGAAEAAAEQRTPDRARRALAGLRGLGGLDAASVTRAEGIEGYLDQERWIFADAAAVLRAHLQLQGAKTVPIDTPAQRARCAQAVEALEAHAAAHPEHWQSIWIAAMGRAALNETAAALALWRRAWNSHPERTEIIREAGLAFLRANLVEEALTVIRDATARIPDDATLWCNRAVSEVLGGDLNEARRCVRESQRLDPADPIARALGKRLDGLSDSRPLPRTLAELERGV